METIFETVIENLEKNNIKGFYVETKEEAVVLVSQLLKQEDLVSVGGSISLFESGVIDHLRCGRYNFLDRHKEGLTEREIRNIFVQTIYVDAFLCSSNAITKAGELYNVDGNANRISAISFGPKSVIMIVGKNKIVENIHEAIKRVKTFTAPQLCKKIGKNTYCSKTGHCISIEKEESNMTSGCDSPDRTCCTYLITGRQRIKDRIKVILVNEDLGC